MIRLFSISLLFLFLSVNSLEGQFLKEFNHGIGYFGNNFINPGIEYNIESSFRDSRRKAGKILPFGESTLNLSLTSALYWDPFSHMGFYNYVEVNYRQYFGKRMGVQFGFGPGYQLSFTSDNYKVDENFNVTKKAVVTNAYFVPEFSAGVFFGNRDQTYRVISNLSFAALVPYNIFAVPVFNYHLTYQF